MSELQPERNNILWPTDSQYEIQHFGCDADEFINGAIEIINLQTHDTIHDLLMTFNNKFNDGDKRQRKTAAKDLKNLYKEAINAGLEDFKEKVKQLFKIPAHVLLPEDKCQRKQYSSTDIVNVNKDIKQLQQRLVKAIIIETSLKQSYGNMKKSLSEINDELKQRAFRDS